MRRRNNRTTTDVVGGDGGGGGGIVDIRPNRKCFPFHGCLFALLLLLIAINAPWAECRPSADEDEWLPQDFKVNEEYKDADNLEIHHVKYVDGKVEEEHPIIMYKEDFVDEDYDPSKNTTKRQRKYKDIAHRRRHKTTPSPDGESEKIYFDFLPETPLLVEDEYGNVKPSRTQYKLQPASQDEKQGDDSATIKDKLLKRPKKFHRRVRRDLASGGEEQSVRTKRNPFFRHHAPQNAADVQQHVQTHYVYVKHAVPGKKRNGLDIPIEKVDIGIRIAADEEDRYVFPSPVTTRPTRRPQESVFRDPRPENFDYSFMNPPSGPTTESNQPIFNRRPVTTRPPESVFRDPRPENFDFAFQNNRGQSSSSAASSPGSQQASNVRTTTAAPPAAAPAEPAGISQCVWAIVNCCSNRNSEIRYSCFEQNGCFGAFWGLNPCAEPLRDNFVSFVADYYN
ncbi:hadley [Musca autumnalis]|uniref:hadley n=1 Tax=Musca autumnalis TaxID=221902 RepID=UPI003CFA95A5